MSGVELTGERRKWEGVFDEEPQLAFGGPLCGDVWYLRVITQSRKFNTVGWSALLQSVADANRSSTRAPPRVEIVVDAQPRVSEGLNRSIG